MSHGPALEVGHFRVHPGAGDLIALLDELKKMTLEGRLNLLCVSFGTVDNEINHDTAWVEGSPVPWCRAVAAVSSHHHHLMDKGLVIPK
jgi:hypothetical protein